VNETTARPTYQPLNPPESGGRPAGNDPAAEFERLYRAHVRAVTAFFARRSSDAQTVADLTADTFVQVITSFGAFDPGKGTARTWVFGIARRIYAAPAKPAASSGTRCCSWPAAGS
jgi:RNA polymerase sigma-70 factor (ECF subfamily)